MMRKSLILLMFLVPLTACGDRYRYTCQNPDKAKTAECSCDGQGRTKNKAIGALDLDITTTTIRLLAGIDC